MAQNVHPRKPWYEGLSKWSTRLMVVLFAVGMLIVVVDLGLMVGFALETYGLPLPGTATPTALPQWTPTMTATPTRDLQPTATPTQVAEPTATPTSTVEPSATPTQVVEPTATPTAVLWPTATPTPVIVDWRGEYFDNDATIGLPALVRNDPHVYFDWGYGAPDNRLSADGFSARWTRVVEFTAGLYRFHALVDDGVRLYVDGDLVLNEWRDGAPREVTADRRLSTGVHALRIEYYERSGVAVAQVWWEKVTTYPDWKGAYWPNRHLSGDPALVRNDPSIDFDWEQGGPGGNLPKDNFSARWTQKVHFGKGTYRFHVLVDDGARLWVDDRLIVDAWYDHSAHELVTDYALAKGTHSLQIEYYERSGDARISVWWEKVASPSYPDWKGAYWSNRRLSGDPALVRNDPRVDFNWGSHAPSPGLPADNFSARWTRKTYFEAATYRFHVLVDDGARLWVDDRLIVDAWYDHSAHELVKDYALAKGTHSLQVEYFERSGGARIQVWWEKVTSPSYPDWKGEYWPNRHLSGDPALVRNDTSIDFNWGSHAPSPGLPADNFSARWTRKTYFEAATYRFHVLVDDGVRLWVDDRLIVDAWYDHSAHELVTDYALAKGTHSLQVEYFERSGGARIQVWWEKVASPSYPDWKGEYWPNRKLGGKPALVRNDPSIDFDWKDLAPAAGMPKDHFTVRWSRVEAFQSGVYRFYAWADDGVRVYVDGGLVLDEWHGFVDEVYMVDLPLSGTHQVVVEYVEYTGDARVRFWWKRMSDLPTVTPTNTPTATPTSTPTSTPTNTPTVTPTKPTNTPTATPTNTPTSTPTATPTNTPTATPTNTPTSTPTNTPTATPTNTPTTEPTPRVRLNEVLPEPRATDWDGDGYADDEDEWIELYNAERRVVDLGGWLLDNGKRGSTPYKIPRGTVLEGGGFLVLYRSATGIVLEDGGDQVRLLTPRGAVVDTVAFGWVGPDSSYARGRDGAWRIYRSPSPGKPNPGRT